jgi:hypothetical protein
VFDDELSKGEQPATYTLLRLVMRTVFMTMMQRLAINIFRQAAVEYLAQTRCTRLKRSSVGGLQSLHALDAEACYQPPKAPSGGVKVTADIRRSTNYSTPKT